MPVRYPNDADASSTGTVYYVGSNTWGVTPMGEADYIAWLETNNGNALELKIEYFSLTEENILTNEKRTNNEKDSPCPDPCPAPDRLRRSGGTRYLSRGRFGRHAYVFGGARHLPHEGDGALYRAPHP